MLVDDEKKNIWGRFTGPPRGASVSIVAAVIESRLVEFSHEFAGSIINNEKGSRYWYHTINAWIDELINSSIDSTVKWSTKDRLMEEYILPDTAKFKSENQRENDYIYLFHLWVNLVNVHG